MTRTLLAHLPRVALSILVAGPLHALTFRSSQEVVGRQTEFQFISQDGKTFAGTTLEAGRAAAFRCSESGGFQILGTSLPSVTEGVWTQGMSPDGSVVFGYLQHGAYPNIFLEGFVWNQANGFRRIGHLVGSSYSVCSAISPDGLTIAGQAEASSVVSSFLWTSGNGIEPFPDRFPDFPTAATGPVYLSNDARTVWADTWDNGSSVILWHQGFAPTIYTDLPGGYKNLSVQAVTHNGALAFGSGATGTGFSAVEFRPDGTLKLLLPNQPFQSMTRGATSDGRLVIGHVDYRLDASSLSATDSFMLDRQTGNVRFLSALIAESIPAATGWNTLYLTAISGDGNTAIGSGIDPSGNFDSFVLEGLKDLIIPPDKPLSIRAKKRLVLDRQTGLFEQIVTVRNPNAGEISGFELVVTSLPGRARLYNASSHKGSTWRIKHDQPLAGGAAVTLVLKYYTPQRGTVIHPVVSVVSAGTAND